LGIFIKRSVNEIDINVNVMAFSERVHVNTLIVENYDLLEPQLVAAKFSVFVFENGATEPLSLSGIFDIVHDVHLHIANSFLATGLL